MINVRIHNLVKKYQTAKEAVVAVDGISLEILEGELFGIIGPDGAGKTSLFRMLTTLLLPDGGEAWVGPYHIVKDYKAIRQISGYMPGRFSLYQDLSVKENLEFFATIFNTTIAANYDLIKDIYVQIEPFKNRRAGQLSGGMKQKLALCCALIHKPGILFLDEPTTGVDAVSRKEFWEMLKGLKEQGITILVSTPYMDEASLCDRVALMQSGRLLITGTPSTIASSFSGHLLAVKAENMFTLLKDISSSSLVEDVYTFGACHHVLIKEENVPVLRRYLENKGHTSLEITTTAPGIEDCFMQLMKQHHE